MDYKDMEEQIIIDLIRNKGKYTFIELLTYLEKYSTIRGSTLFWLAHGIWLIKDILNKINKEKEE